MCKAMEDMRNEALERGRKEGHILTMIENIKNMKIGLGLTDQQVKDLLKISADDWKIITAQI